MIKIPPAAHAYFLYHTYSQQLLPNTNKTANQICHFWSCPLQGNRCCKQAHLVLLMSYYKAKIFYRYFNYRRV